MHLANALARRRRHATRLIAGNYEKPRLFGLARRSISTLGVFGSARDGFAARLFTCGFETAILLGGACRLQARFFTRSFPRDLEATLLIGVARRSLLGRFLESLLACLFPCGFETMLFLGSPHGRLAARLFPYGCARRFDTALVFGSAGGRLATRFFPRGLARGLANGI